MTKENSTSIHIKDFQGVKIHSFVAPYEYSANATHIIETANELVIIDTQFITPLAQAFRGYVDSLNKPINRVFISHGHPDHYFGFASAFADQKGYSLEAVNSIIAEYGPQMITNQKPTFGDLIPDDVLVPQNTVNAGTSETIDGLNYEFEAVEGAENEIQLLIKLPEIGVVIAQDLVYSGVHLWLGMGWFDNWINELQKIADLAGYNYILPGHGLPCIKDEVVNNIHYLKMAKSIHEKGLSPEDFKKELLAAYPHREAVMMFDLYLGFLFGQMSSH
jgi:glyoxylase-like metal-dependent hydrolase (beta-lactamase superfamily II)